jgi:hypothetical protein
VQVMHERALRQQEAAARDELQEIVKGGTDNSTLQACAPTRSPCVDVVTGGFAQGSGLCLGPVGKRLGSPYVRLRAN